MKSVGWLLLAGLLLISGAVYWLQLPDSHHPTPTSPNGMINLGIIAGGPQGFATRSSQMPYAGTYMGVRFMDPPAMGKGILAQRFLQWEIEPCNGKTIQKQCGESTIYTYSPTSDVGPEHPRYPFYYPLANLDSAAILAGVKFDRDDGAAVPEVVRKVRHAEMRTRGRLTAIWNFQFNANPQVQSLDSWLQAAYGNDHITVGWDETSHHNWLQAPPARQDLLDHLFAFRPVQRIVVQFEWDASDPSRPMQRFRTWQSPSIRYLGQPTRINHSPQGPILRQEAPDKNGWTEWRQR